MRQRAKEDEAIMEQSALQPPPSQRKNDSIGLGFSAAPRPFMGLLIAQERHFLESYPREPSVWSAQRD